MTAPRPTPLPWKFKDGPPGVLILIADDKPYLGTLRYSDNPNLAEPEARANAAYIEKATNNYPALVAAMVEALKAIAELKKTEGIHLYGVENKIEEALRAAGEL